MREYTAPTTLVVKRIPKEVLEGIYGLSIRTKGAEEGGDGRVTGTELLVAYAGTSTYFIVIIHYLILSVLSSRSRIYPVGPGKP